MTLEEFIATLTEAAPPRVAAPLEALWHDARGDWERAHEIAQNGAAQASHWVHAYLHRKEGDAANARYWYERAGRPEARTTFEAEWRDIVGALLEK